MTSAVNPESSDEQDGGLPTAPRYRAFLSHNSADKPAVEELARRLEKEGISCFLDKWHLIPGDPWQPALEDALEQSATCVVFCGPSGLGPWQNEEMRAAIARRVSDPNRAFRVVPVLLPGAQREQRSRLPTFLVSATWVEFRESLDEADAFHRLKCGIRGEPPGQAPGGALFEGTCPYRGLHVFEADHARFFFGRDAEVDWMLERLASNIGTPQEDRFLGVVGASGSGKSSLVRAGLIPALREGGSRSGKQIAGSTDWPIVIFKPGTDPLKALADALWSEPLLRRLIPDPLGLSDLLLADARRLHATIGTALASSPEQRRLVIVVDQFEELFTQSSAEAEPQRQAFIDNLLYASTVRGGRVFVIITMRADFYGKCARYEQLAHALSDSQELVPPLSEDGLRAAIEHPAQLCGLELEAGLVDLLVQDMRKQPAGALPLLQQTLYMLWERRDGRRLTVRAYRQIGEIEGALESHADRVYRQELGSDDDREICRRVLLMLTSPGEGTEDTRRRVPRAYLGNSGSLAAVLDTLVRARLVTISETDSPQVEVTHEALIHGWGKLRDWIDADRESLRAFQQLITAAERWRDRARDPADLYRGSRLVQAEEWRDQHRGDLANLPLVNEFINASIEDRDAAKRRTRLTASVIFGTVAIAAVGLSMLWMRAETANRELEKTKATLENVLKLVNTNPEFVQTAPQHRSPPEITTNNSNVVSDIQKTWGPTPRTLSVSFFNGKPEDHELIESIAQEWTKYANLRFDFLPLEAPATGKIRIAVSESGANWSYVGTDLLHVPPDKPTMNLSLRPVADARRNVLLHFGHVLGLIYEHANPNASIPWDKDAVYLFYTKMGWTKEMVDLQLFTKIKGPYRPFDPHSIMMHPVPNELTIGDFEVPQNKELSRGDKEFVGWLYPFGPAIDLQTDATAATVQLKRLHLQRFRFEAHSAGRHNVRVQGPAGAELSLYGPGNDIDLIAEVVGQPNPQLSEDLAPGIYYVKLRHFDRDGPLSYDVTVKALP